MDKYHATVYAPFPEVLQTLVKEWSPSTEWVDKPHTSGNYGYLRTGTRWEQELQVRYGGEQPWPNVSSCVGVVSPEVADILSRWPHRVTRADTKIDLQGEGVFDQLVAVVDDIRRQRPTVPESTEYRDRDGIKGRTVYVGSDKSEFQVCIYDKSLQMRDVKGITVPPNIVRLEGRYRPPNKQAGIQASKLKPVDYWGVSGWGRELYQAVANEAIEPVLVPRNGASDLDQSAVSCVAQYFKTLHLLAMREGSWAKLGEFLEYLVPEAEERIKQRMEGQLQRNEVVKS